MRQVHSEGLTMSLGGAIVGGVGVMAGFRMLRSVFAGVETADLGTGSLAVVLLAVAALAAAYIPARRAARLNPVDALRSD